MEYTLIMPEEKAPELVKLSEANPFENATSEKAEDAANSEQNRIKEVLMSLPPVGMSKMGSGRLVAYLGDIRLEEKAFVPHVLPDQTLELRVKEITPTGVTLVWVEKKPTGLPPREELIPVDLRPTVTVSMPGRGRGAPGDRSGGTPPVIGRQTGRTSTSTSVEPSRMMANTPPAGAPPRAVPVEEQELPKMNLTPPPGTPPAESESPASTLMNILFGNPVNNGQAGDKKP